MNQDQLRDQADRLEALARQLFEQQFIRHGGRQSDDPEWDDDSVDRDDWRDRARDVAPLLAEAGRVAYLEARVGELHQTIGDLRGEQFLLTCALDRSEASRRDWATEALRLRMEIEKLREIALDPNALYSSILVGVGGEAGTVPSDEQVQLAVGLFLRHVKRDLADPDWHPKDDCGRGPLCRRHGCEACIAAADPDLAGPQCSVHPDTDARLLAVAEARAAVDTGERHDLDDVAREFGVDLDEDVSVHPDRGGNDD